MSTERPQASAKNAAAAVQSVSTKDDDLNAAAGAATAKKTNERARTEDIASDANIDFASLQLSHEILLGISDLGWKHPSPVQQKAIPLGKFGADMIVQAKSGTGKTCVFAVVALEKINLGRGSPQAIILAPTREIAVQITDVINSVGKHLQGLSCQTFIGGMSIKSDLVSLRRCHIIVGTPGKLEEREDAAESHTVHTKQGGYRETLSSMHIVGRVAQLIEERQFDLTGIRLFILDEADKLLDENFLPQVEWIAQKLPRNQSHRPLQTMAFSATFTPKLIETVKKMMKSPQEILLAPDAPSLRGVKQYFYQIPVEAMESSWKQWTAKVTKLLEIFSKISFHQCVVFTNDRARAEVLKGKLNDEGWPSNFIAGGQAQQQRLGTMTALKDFQIRVLISTDLTARGIDIERVNLVINLDMPADPETYLHRVGRTGRFGTYGVAISFVNAAELSIVEKICSAYQTSIAALPAEIPREYYAYTLESEKETKSLATLEEKRQQALSNPTKTELIDPSILPTKQKSKDHSRAGKESKRVDFDDQGEEQDGEEEDEDYDYDEEEEGYDDDDAYEEGDEDYEEGEDEGEDEEAEEEDEDLEEPESAESRAMREAAWAQYYQQQAYAQYQSPYPSAASPYAAPYSFGGGYSYPSPYSYPPCPVPSYGPPPPPPPPVPRENPQHTYHLYQTYYALLYSYYQILSAYQAHH